MALMSNVSPLKILGWFGIALIIGLWFGGMFIGIGKAIKTGDWKSAINEPGARLFAVDYTLKQETSYLLDPLNVKQYDLIFHLLYSLTLIFLLFYVAFILFRIGNWMEGIVSFNPLADVILIALIILSFMFLQFMYTYLFLHETIIPLTGVFDFLINLPAIFNKLLII